MGQETLIVLIAAILLSGLTMVVLALVIIRPKGSLLGESLRILPDLIRLAET